MRRIGLPFPDFVLIGRNYALIVAAMREKERQNPQVAAVLRSTRTLVLKADHLEEPNAAAAWRYCTTSCNCARSCVGRSDETL